MSLLAASLVDAAIVLALGLAAAAALRRRSAALRHAVLATAILAASLMPAFELFLPQLAVIRWQDAASVISSGPALVSDGSAVAVSRDVDPGAGVSWPALLGLAWILGAAAIGAGLVTGLVRLARLRHRCTPLQGRWRELALALAGECGVTRDVALLQSTDPSLLVTCGVLKPAIILPATASGWTDERRRIVLRHELAHIARHDAALQLGGEALRILHWMNPLVWIACRRLRQESEYACDDAVLGGGVEATVYATHLLEVARQLSARHAAWAAAPAIAHPSTLERRIAAMLQRHQNRAPLGRRGWAAAGLVSLCISVPLAAAGIGAASAPDGETTSGVAIVPPGGAPGPANGAVLPVQGSATVAGQVVDQSGGTLPGVNVALTNSRTGEQISTRTNASGRFSFRGIRPSAYELVLQLPGFKTVNDSVTVADGASVERAITMPLGSLQETVTVACSGAPASGSLSVRVPASLPRVQGGPARWILSRVFPVVSAQEPPRPIRVGGSLRPPMKIRDVKPVCTPGVPQGETAVRLSGIVDTDGNISDLTSEAPDSGVAAPADVVEAAMEAVRQWKFTPTLLNGRPVDVEITVDITFKKS
jgi:beta-lactamase regulating signal transducer with metallopeptidase domain